MKIDVINYSDAITKDRTHGVTVIIIDVLRCTSCIITALNNGAKDVIIFAGVEEARAYAELQGRANCVLGGERHALQIDGYDVGNSPLQYSKDLVTGKTVIMSTTNGARAISGIKDSAATLIAASINHTAAAYEAVRLNEDVLVVCSGTNGEVSADDVIVAGAVAADIAGIAPNTFLTDSAILSKSAYSQFVRGELDVKNTYHGRHLVNLGKSFLADIDYCFQENIINYVPRCVGTTHDGCGAIIK